MSEPIDFRRPTRIVDQDAKEASNAQTPATKPLLAGWGLSVSLLLASSVTLGAVDASVTSPAIQETGPSTRALERAIELIEDSGIAEAARSAEDRLETAQWSNWSNWQNY